MAFYYTPHFLRHVVYYADAQIDNLPVGTLPESVNKIVVKCRPDES